VELAVLTARVDAPRQVTQQPLVESSPGKRRVEHARVDAGDERLEAGRDELVCELARIAPPEREQPAPVFRNELLLAVRANIFEGEQRAPQTF